MILMDNAPGAQTGFSVPDPRDKTKSRAPEYGFPKPDSPIGGLP